MAALVASGSTWRVHPSVPPNRPIVPSGMASPLRRESQDDQNAASGHHASRLQPTQARPGQDGKRPNEGCPGTEIMDGQRVKTSRNLRCFTSSWLQSSDKTKEWQIFRTASSREKLGYWRLFETLLGAMNTTYHRTMFTTLMSRNEIDDDYIQCGDSRTGWRNLQVDMRHVSWM
ncbi:hypothetical protein PpBr36_05393 [Pyricularia pennisetigena]|uniref:hypothetical protein n=1 Tax=Pyricularia pennisetigena TaxID=1578925 RepID=UPI0011502B0B|nr:hypothetical protein PpBr36_05393 [Pyricularia pennisetigena]TLS27551.1 hypothetical protein PpBr36_05393 [Pyricularia pennisetigena]